MIDAEVRRWLNDLQAGRNVTVGEVTLTNSATSTTVTASGCSSGSCVLMFPKDSGGATEFGGGSLYIVPGKGQFVITHSNTVSTRTFRYVVFTGTQPL